MQYSNVQNFNPLPNELKMSSPNLNTGEDSLIKKTSPEKIKQSLQGDKLRDINLILRDESFPNFEHSLLSNYTSSHRNLFLQLFNGCLRFYQGLPMLRPQNPYLVGWHILHLIIILYFILEIPLLVGYGRQVWVEEITYLFWLLILFLLILIVDLLISPLKMFYKNGILIKDHQTILKNYLKLQLWIDSLGVLAIFFSLVFSFSFKINWLKILFLPKLFTVHHINHKIKEVLIFNNKAKMLYLIGRLVIFIYLVAHYLGIGFYILGKWVYENNYYGPNTPNTSWLYNAEAYSQLYLLLDWKGQYLYTMYYSIGVTTTIAYGDITPLNPLQVLYTIFALIINTIAFGYILSEILRVLIQGFYAKFRRSRSKETLENMLMRRRVSHKLQKSIRFHTQQIQKQEMYRNRTIQKQNINFLPQDVKFELYLKIYRQFLLQLGLINLQLPQIHSSTLFIEKVLYQIEERRYLVGDSLYSLNQKYLPDRENHRVYFVKNQEDIPAVILGVGSQVSIGFQENQKSQKSQHGIFFENKKRVVGEVQFVNGYNRDHWALLRKNILVYELKRCCFLRVLRYASKQFYFYFCQLREKIASHYCMVCREKTHHFSDCPKCNYRVEVSNLIRKEKTRTNMERINNQRIEELRTKTKINLTKSNTLNSFKSLLRETKRFQKKVVLKGQNINYLLYSQKNALFLEDDLFQTMNIQKGSSAKFSSMSMQKLVGSDHISSSSQSSQTTSQDLECFIRQTKLLIKETLIKGKALQKSNDQILQESQNSLTYSGSIFNRDFDSFYHFPTYKSLQNPVQVIKKYNNIQQIKKQKEVIQISSPSFPRLHLPR